MGSHEEQFTMIIDLRYHFPLVITFLAATFSSNLLHAEDEATLTVSNNTRSPVEMFWVEPGGKEVSYGVIAAGKTIEQGTFIGDSWIIRDKSTRRIIRKITATKPRQTEALTAKPASPPNPVVRPASPSTAESPPTAGTAAALGGVLGEYEKKPASNGWHTGTISKGLNGLEWKNKEGFKWSLTLDAAAGKLRTGKDNPYDSQGIRDFTLQKRGNVVTGFTFNGELYSRKIIPKPAPQSNQPFSVRGKWIHGPNQTPNFSDAMGVRHSITTTGNRVALLDSSGEIAGVYERRNPAYANKYFLRSDTGRLSETDYIEFTSENAGRQLIGGKFYTWRRVTAGTPPTVNPARNLSGMWQDSNGGRIEISQKGNQITATGKNNAVLRWWTTATATLNGNQFTMTHRKNNTVTDTVRGTATSDSEIVWSNKSRWQRVSGTPTPPSTRPTITTTTPGTTPLRDWEQAKDDGIYRAAKAQLALFWLPNFAKLDKNSNSEKPALSLIRHDFRTAPAIWAGQNSNHAFGAADTRNLETKIEELFPHGSNVTCHYWVEAGEQEMTFFIASDANTIHMAFQGTYRKKHDDMNGSAAGITWHALTTNPYFSGPYTHSGWAAGTNSIYETVKHELIETHGAGERSNKEIKISGYSMGGVIAQYTTYRLLWDNDTIFDSNKGHTLITFGAPHTFASFDAWLDGKRREKAPYLQVYSVETDKDWAPTAWSDISKLPSYRFGTPVDYKEGKDWSFSPQDNEHDRSHSLKNTYFPTAWKRKDDPFLSLPVDRVPELKYLGEHQHDQFTVQVNRPSDLQANQVRITLQLADDTKWWKRLRCSSASVGTINLDAEGRGNSRSYTIDGVNFSESAHLEFWKAKPARVRVNRFPIDLAAFAGHELKFLWRKD